MSQRRAIWSWALYDWANSAYATTVMAGFFPVFFKQYWATDLSVNESTLQLGIANSLSSLAIVVLAPLLGAVADSLGARKRFLFIFTALGALSTAVLPLVAQGNWLVAVMLYTLASIGFAGGLGFYDSLIVSVASPERYHRVSALGFSLGYLGGGILFAINVTMTLQPALFGLADAAEAIKLSFLTVAIWWGLFTLPLMLWVEEPRREPVAAFQAIRSAIVELRQTFHEIRRLKPVFLFLAAYWLYIDGVDTVIRMAVDYGLALGFDSASLLTALLITQFVGFPSAILFGRIGERMGPKGGIYIALAVYTGVVIYAYSMDRVEEFYLLAVVIGLVQGGLQALSRSFYASLIPAEKSGEFFGFFNMMGKFAAVLGPVMVGSASVITGDARSSLLTLLLLFAAGAWLLSRVQAD